MPHTNRHTPFFCFLLTLFWVSALWGQSPDSVIAIEGATLIDGTGRAPLARMTILIEGNRIHQIGKQGELTPPRGARVISASGKYIIPGLIDSHVHYRHPWMHKLFLANGVTTVRDLGGDIERVLTLRQEIRVGNILAPRLFVSGMGINPRSMKALNFSSPGEMTEALVKAGVDGIKVTGYTPSELEEIVEVAHANGLIVYGHTGPMVDGRAPGALLAIQSGLDGIEHINALIEDSQEGTLELPGEFDATLRDHLFRYWYGRVHRKFNQTKADRLIQLMVQEGVYWAPTLVNSSRHERSTEELASDPALRYIPEGSLDTQTRFGEEAHQDWKQTLALAKNLIRQFHEAGGLLIAGTDTPGAALPGWSVHQEMELFVQAGISPMAALQTATLNNAKVLQQDKQLGTVEVGKYADLVILDADPLEDIHNARKIHRVIKNGLLLDPQELLEENLKQFGERGERQFDMSGRR